MSANVDHSNSLSPGYHFSSFLSICINHVYYFLYSGILVMENRLSFLWLPILRDKKLIRQRTFKCKSTHAETISPFPHPFFFIGLSHSGPLSICLNHPQGQVPEN